MQITRFFVENFKAIGPLVEIPVRSITLLFGKNSVGKSSLIQSLLYAVEIILTKRSDRSSLGTGNHLIDIGHFYDYVYLHDVTKSVRIGFECTITEDDADKLHHDSGGQGGGVLQSAAEHSSDQHLAVAILLTLKCDEVSGMGRVQSVEMHYNSIPYIKISAGDDGVLRVTYWHYKLECLNKYLEFFDSPNGEPDGTLVPMPWKFVEAELNQIIENANEKYPACSIALDSPTLFHPIEFPANAKCSEASRFLEGTYTDALECISKCLPRPTYISYTRIRPWRDFRISRISHNGLWTDGTGAWEYLSAAADKSPKLFAKTNDYIGGAESLGLGHKIVATKFQEVSTRSGERAGDVLESTAETSPVRVRIEIVDLTTNIRTSPAEVGTGLSQVIPVVVSAASKLHKLVIVEQPELHLHPSAQCFLGDIFIKEVRSQQGKQFIIETHSEHLLLRMLRRIRETTNRECSDDSLRCDRFDFSIVFVGRKSGCVTCTPLPITIDGDFICEWPEGFFDDRAKELF